MTRQEIMKDLREIRYYYSRKKGFDELKNEIASNIIAEKVQRYNDAVRCAPMIPIMFVRKSGIRSTNTECRKNRTSTGSVCVQVCMRDDM